MFRRLDEEDHELTSSMINEEYGTQQAKEY